MLIQKSSTPRLLFIGFGNVGQKVAELFLSKSTVYPGLSNFKPQGSWNIYKSTWRRCKSGRNKSGKIIQPVY